MGHIGNAPGVEFLLTLGLGHRILRIVVSTALTSEVGVLVGNALLPNVSARPSTWNFRAGAQVSALASAPAS
jgi:hypothetical protein